MGAEVDLHYVNVLQDVPFVCAPKMFPWQSQGRGFYLLRFHSLQRTGIFNQVYCNVRF